MKNRHVTQTPVKTLDAFMEWAYQLEGDTYLFRGLPSAAYTLGASAYPYLNPKVGPAQLLKHNKALIKDTRLQGHDERDGRALSDLEVLAELQYLRVPTCLIEFTASALAALWFACQSTSEGDSDGKVSAVHDDPNRITKVTPDLLTTDTHIDHFLQADANGKYPRYRWQPSQLQNPMIPQESVFLLGGKIIEPDAECVIAAKHKQEILESLRSFLHISNLTRAPDSGGAGRRPKAKRSGRRSSAAAYRKRGDQAMRSGAFAAAIAAYTQAITRDPNNVAAYSNRGIAYESIGEYQLAINDHNAAIALNPDISQVYNNRGIAYMGIRDFQAAIDDYTRAITLNPDDPTAYHNRGNAYTETGDFQAAIREYDTALARNPNYDSAYYNRGNAYQRIGDLRGAIRDYDTAILLNPQHVLAYYNRGIVRFRFGRPHGAEQDFQAALRLAKRAGNGSLIAQIERELRNMNADI